jgi:hypothetical protein
MNAAERVELSKVVRLRARVAKADVAQHEAKLIADFESKLAARYDSQDRAFADLTAAGEAKCRELDAELARRCKDAGIPESFRPTIYFSWMGRGENGLKERRAELRRVAATEIAARGKRAVLEIERASADLLTQLAAGALGSDEARKFLEAMPRIEALMAPLDVDEAEQTRLRLVAGR